MSPQFILPRDDSMPTPIGRSSGFLTSTYVSEAATGKKQSTGLRRGMMAGVGVLVVGASAVMLADPAARPWFFLLVAVLAVNAAVAVLRKR